MQLSAVENGQNDCFCRPVGRLRHDAKLGRLRVFLRPETDVPISTSCEGRGGRCDKTPSESSPPPAGTQIWPAMNPLYSVNGHALARVGSVETGISSTRCDIGSQKRENL